MSRTLGGDQKACAKTVCVHYCGVQNYSVSGFIIFELFTVNFFQDWAGWGIFTVIPGNPRRMKGDSQHLEARPELQDWLRSELFTVKNSRTGPFSNYLGNNFELYSIRLLYSQRKSWEVGGDFWDIQEILQGFRKSDSLRSRHNNCLRLKAESSPPPECYNNPPPPPP